MSLIWVFNKRPPHYFRLVPTRLSSDRRVKCQKTRRLWHLLRLHHQELQSQVQTSRVTLIHLTLVTCEGFPLINNIYFPSSEGWTATTPPVQALPPSTARSWRAGSCFTRRPTTSVNWFSRTRLCSPSTRPRATTAPWSGRPGARRSGSPSAPAYAKEVSTTLNQGHGLIDYIDCL